VQTLLKNKIHDMLFALVGAPAVILLKSVG
jgi:hypothetical protein